MLTKAGNVLSGKKYIYVYYMSPLTAIIYRYRSARKVDTFFKKYICCFRMMFSCSFRMIFISEHNVFNSKSVKVRLQSPNKDLS